MITYWSYDEGAPGEAGTLHATSYASVGLYSSVAGTNARHDHGSKRLACAWQCCARVATLHEGLRRKAVAYAWPYCTGGRIARVAILPDFVSPSCNMASRAIWPPEQCGHVETTTSRRRPSRNFAARAIWPPTQCGRPCDTAARAIRPRAGNYFAPKSLVDPNSNGGDGRRIMVGWNQGAAGVDLGSAASLLKICLGARRRRTPRARADLEGTERRASPRPLRRCPPDSILAPRPLAVDRRAPEKSLKIGSPLLASAASRRGATSRCCAR